VFVVAIAAALYPTKAHGDIGCAMNQSELAELREQVAWLKQRIYDYAYGEEMGELSDYNREKVAQGDPRRVTKKADEQTAERREPNYRPGKISEATVAYSGGGASRPSPPARHREEEAHVDAPQGD
jgi:hypothetical protein